MDATCLRQSYGQRQSHDVFLGSTVVARPAIGMVARPDPRGSVSEVPVPPPQRRPTGPRREGYGLVDAGAASATGAASAASEGNDPSQRPVTQE